MAERLLRPLPGFPCRHEADRSDGPVADGEGSSTRDFAPHSCRVARSVRSGTSSIDEGGNLASANHRVGPWKLPLPATRLRRQLAVPRQLCVNAKSAPPSQNWKSELRSRSSASTMRCCAPRIAPSADRRRGSRTPPRAPRSARSNASRSSRRAGVLVWTPAPVGGPSGTQGPRVSLGQQSIQADPDADAGAVTCDGRPSRARRRGSDRGCRASWIGIPDGSTARSRAGSLHRPADQLGARVARRVRAWY